MRLKKGEKSYKLPRGIVRIRTVTIVAYGLQFEIQPMNVYGPPPREIRDGVPGGFGVFHDDTCVTHIVFMTPPSKGWKCCVLAEEVVIL